MSLRDQIKEAIIVGKSKLEITLHGHPCEISIPRLGDSHRSSSNIRKIDRKLSKRVEMLADKQMQILAS
jgi:hypothetical protein